MSLTLPDVDVTGGGHAVTLSAGATDVGSGVDRVYVALDRAVQSGGVLTTNFILFDSNDSYADGTSSMQQLFDANTASGTYNVTQVIVYDKAGNQTAYDPSQLTAMGIDTSFNVASNTAADTSPPVLTSLMLPDVDLTGGAHSATLTAGATDVGSGVDRVYVALDRAIQSGGVLTTNFILFDSNDSYADGTSSMQQLFDANTASGTYNVTQVIVYDKAGNHTTYDPSQLTAMGIDTSFNVVSNTAADTSPPVLTSLTLPDVDISNGAHSVTLSAGATDVGSGVDRVYVALDRAIQSGGVLTTNFILFDSTDSYSDGMSSRQQMFDAGTAAGTYNVSQVIVYDKAGNQTAYDPSQLAAMGIDTSFTVIDKIRGTAGDDILTGTTGNDNFDLSQGGNDQAFGDAGNDGFFFGAAFTAADHVDGGDGANDQIGLQGDYTGANKLILGANTITGIEAIVLLPGFSYDITTVDANVAAGQVLKIQATQLAAGQSLTFDGSAETNGSLVTFGGQGDDRVTGGGGDDGFYFGPGGFNGADLVNGGGGSNDQLALDGDYTITLGGNVTNVEVLVLLHGPSATPNHFNVTSGDLFVGAGQTKTIFGLQVETAITFDGSGEHDGAFRIYGGSGGDTLTGSDGSDWLFGSAGADSLTGGAGADTYYYDDASQSTSIGYDRIIGFDDAVDKIDLPFAVTGFAAPASGNLSTASFDSQLAAAFAGLTSHQAGMFTATGGDLSGHSFLVVDANGSGGYQAGSDYVIEIVSPATPIDNPAIFI